ncbi:MAG: DUF3553 domain-containing protein [Phycisphaerales bacterium]|nr:DUF3553 domain-containing protein [Phycisphaerales bacterium]
MVHATKLHRFKRGDLVSHPLRPEWGPGVVITAASIVHEDQPAQRLVVDFSNHGRVTLNTGVAQLIAREGTMPMTMTTTSSVPAKSTTIIAQNTNGNGRGWLDTLDPSNVGSNELYRLGDAMTDPFVSPSRRLQATLDTFRFGNDPRHARNLLDWAVAQTGLKDPMTKYTRHELEQGFRRFVRDRDNHLFDLVRSMKRQGGQDALFQIKNSITEPLAKTSLERAIRA